MIKAGIRLLDVSLSERLFWTSTSPLRRSERLSMFPVAVCYSITTCEMWDREPEISFAATAILQATVLNACVCGSEIVDILVDDIPHHEPQEPDVILEHSWVALPALRQLNTVLY